MKQLEEFNVWPLMVDLLSSILIIIILFNFFNVLLKPENIAQKVVEMKKKSFYQDFNPLFKQELAREELTIINKFDYLQMRFSNNILFEKGLSELNFRGEDMLKKLGLLLPKENTHTIISHIQVEGHTDKTPFSGTLNFPKNNWELSAARALSVVEFLTDNGNNVNPKLFSANGFGEHKPVSENIEDNRRIEIKIYFSELNN